MNQHEVLSRHRLKGRLGKEGAEAAKAKAGTESRDGKIWFCTSSTVLFGSASWLICCLVGSSKPELLVSSVQASKGRQKTQNKTKITNKIKQKTAQKRYLAQLGFFLCLHFSIHALTPWPPANSLHSRNSLSLPLLSLLVSYCYYHKYFPLTIAGVAQYSGTVITPWWSVISRDHLVLFFPWLTSLSHWKKRKDWTKRSLPFTQKKPHLLNRPHFILS